jgi:hypothetical protein
MEHILDASLNDALWTAGGNKDWMRRSANSASSCQTSRWSPVSTYGVSVGSVVERLHEELQESENGTTRSYHRVWWIHIAGE